MKRILSIATVIVCLYSLQSCSKYVADTKTTTTGSTTQQGQGYTPLSSSTGSSSSSGGNSTSTTSDSADAVYIQGFYLQDISKQIGVINSTTYENSSLYANGYYTKLAQGAYKFWNPLIAPQNHSTYVGEASFPNKGYFTVLSTTSNPGLIVLNNGNDVNPSTSKSYVRFINICDSADAVSINVKITSSNDVAYFSYRKPYDFYATSSAGGVWTSIYNQSYNTNYTNYTAVTPGFYNGEIYLSNGVAFKPTYNLVGGKKYTIIVRQYGYAKPILYYYTIIQHN